MLSVVWLQRPPTAIAGRRPAAPLSRGWGGRPGPGRGMQGLQGQGLLLRVRVWGGPQGPGRARPVAAAGYEGSSRRRGGHEGVGRAEPPRTRRHLWGCAGRRACSIMRNGWSSWPKAWPWSQVPHDGVATGTAVHAQLVRPAFGERRGQSGGSTTPCPPRQVTSGSSAVFGASCSPWGSDLPVLCATKSGKQNRNNFWDTAGEGRAKAAPSQLRTRTKRDLVWGKRLRRL